MFYVVHYWWWFSWWLTALLLAQGGVQATVLDAAPILDAGENLIAVANPRVLALSQATIHLLKRWVFGIGLHANSPIQACKCGIKMAMVKLTLGMQSEQTPSVEQALGSMVRAKFFEPGHSRKNAGSSSGLSHSG